MVKILSSNELFSRGLCVWARLVFTGSLRYWVMVFYQCTLCTRFPGCPFVLYQLFGACFCVLLTIPVVLQTCCQLLMMARRSNRLSEYSVYGVFEFLLWVFLAPSWFTRFCSKKRLLAHLIFFSLMVAVCNTSTYHNSNRKARNVRIAPTMYQLSIKTEIKTRNGTFDWIV